MAAVVLEGVIKRFEGFTAVHGLDLAIESGEFVALLGPSGCGKTTTLRMLAGLEFPTAGRIRIDDRVVNDIAPGKRDVAMVFQSYALYPHMTVAENIAYPLKKRGLGRAERAAKVAEAADLLQVADLLGRKPKQLSGGQQQRVALGRALVRDPKVFLLDEPLSNLDAKLRAYMRAELIELHRRLGRTMVYVTHDQLEAMTMSQRIAVMSAGRLQQFDTPEAVYNRPANRFVADFIGTPSMNLIDGRVEGGTGGPVFRADGFAQPLLPGGVEPATSPAVLGVRPEHVSLGEGENEGLVRVVEPTGHETIVILETRGGHRLTARAAAGTRMAPGERAPFRLEAAALHLFAGDEEGRRLNLDAPASRHHATGSGP